MRIEGKEYRTIWFESNIVKIIDQTKLPHKFIIKDLKTVKDAINAIKEMEVRGAPLIGATAAYGLVLAIVEKNDQSFLNKSAEKLINSKISNSISNLKAFSRFLDINYSQFPKTFEKLDKLCKMQKNISKYSFVFNFI